MSIAEIVAATPTQQQLLDYQNAAATVNQYAYAITNTSLPVLNDPPKTYGDFATQFAPAKAHCLEWTGGIMPTLLEFPGTIANEAADLFKVEDQIAGGWLNVLVQDPTNTEAQQKLASALTTMQNNTKAQLQTATDLLASMNAFANNIGTDASTLSNLAGEALTDIGIDQQNIQTLQGDIDGLKDQIDSLNKLLTLSEIGMGVSLFVGLIGVVCCFIPGAQGIGVGLIVIGVAGEAASITGTVLLNKEINAKNQEITTDQNQIAADHQDIVALQTVNTQFKWLVEANAAAQTAIQTVVDMWQNLDAELTTVTNDLTQVGSDVTAAKYQAALDDLTTAANDWQQVVDFANALAGISYKWQDSNGNWHDFTDQQPSADGATVAVVGQTPVAA